jgi:hypothetical protein
MSEEKHRIVIVGAGIIGKGLQLNLDIDIH